MFGENQWYSDEQRENLKDCPLSLKKSPALTTVNQYQRNADIQFEEMNLSS